MCKDWSLEAMVFAWTLDCRFAAEILALVFTESRGGERPTPRLQHSQKETTDFRMHWYCVACSVGLLAMTMMLMSSVGQRLRNQLKVLRPDFSGRFSQITYVETEKDVKKSAAHSFRNSINKETSLAGPLIKKAN